MILSNTYFLFFTLSVIPPAASQTSRCVFFRCLNSYGHLCLPGERHISDGISYLGDLEEPKSKSKKCHVVETPTLDLWPPHVSAAHMTQIRTFFLPLKEWDWKSKQLQTLNPTRPPNPGLHLSRPVWETSCIELKYRPQFCAHVPIAEMHINCSSQSLKYFFSLPPRFYRKWREPAS